jgi:hypothetical protein
MKEYEQAAPAASVPPHVVLEPKSPALVPVIEVEEMVSEAVPVLVKITTCAFDCVPTVWFPKAMLAILSDTVGDGVNPGP